MGPQPPCLKIASGALLKMLTLQLTFGRSWQAIKPELKIGAAGRGRAPGSRDRGWLGPRETGLRQPLLAKAVLADRPSTGGYSALCWKAPAEEEGNAEGKEGSGRKRGLWRDRNLLVHPQTQGIVNNQTSWGKNPQDEEL